MTIQPILPLPFVEPQASTLLARAQEVADRLRIDVVDRDASAQAPRAEVALLRDGGLLTAVIPVTFGGGGASLADLHSVVRILARVDPSISALFGYHVERVRSLTNSAGQADGGQTARELLRGTVENGWYWGGTGSAQEDDFVLSRVEGGYRATGKKNFATGAAVSDRLVSGGRIDTGETVLRFVVDPGAGGVVLGSDWDYLGQRLTASGSVELRDYFVPDADIFGSFPALAPTDAIASFSRDPQASLIVPAFQLLFGQLYVGIAEGALTEAAVYTRTRSRTWVHSIAESPTSDPFILRHFGDAAAHLQAASALGDQAIRSLEFGFSRGAELTYDERARVATDIAALKVVSTRLALDITARVFETTGARSTKAGVGLDRFWRDARTHTLHDPVEYKILEVGDAFLNGTAPTPSHYR